MSAEAPIRDVSMIESVEPFGGPRKWVARLDCGHEVEVGEEAVMAKEQPRVLPCPTCPRI